MHGFFNKALQGFLTETYGEAVWHEVRSQAGLPFDDFEAMLVYDDALTKATVEAASLVLHRPPHVLLEDLGIFLITHPPFEQLRRLLRFSGANFPEFIHSLDEIAERAHLVMPELDMPQIDVTEETPVRFSISAKWRMPGVGAVLLGAVRAMADDYGTLASLECSSTEDGTERLIIELHDVAYAEGKSFSLGQIAS